MKKILFKTVIVTSIVTLVIVFGGYKVVKVTGEYPFCGSCQEQNGAIAQTNLADPVHGGSNPKGLGIKCTDCHLPHDNLASYIFAKAKNGISEGITVLFKDPKEKDWITNREHARKNYTFDSSCLQCHGDIIKISDANATRNISKMHAKYI